MPPPPAARGLKEVSLEIVKPLFQIFRNSLLSGKVPSLWKIANVTAVHKKGSREEASNYRPISLTCILRKVMETLIRNATMEHLRVNSILTANQHGFIEGRSCLTNLLPTLKSAVPIWTNILQLISFTLTIRKHSIPCLMQDYAQNLICRSGR